MEKSNAYDILLLFPPWLQRYPCPPAGIPCLTSYLKSHGCNPLVLDVCLLFKKSFLISKILLFIQSKILSFRKSSLNTPPITKSRGRGYGNAYTWKQFIKKAGLFLLERVTDLENFFLGRESLPLGQIFEMIEAKAYKTCKIERRLESILKQPIKATNILGISVIYPNQILYSLIIAKIAKKINKNIFVVLGGSQITMHINNLINQKALLNYVDGFIVHEGEMGLCALINALNTDRILNHIPNLYYKDKGAYRASEGVEFVMPVEEYKTPDFSGFDLKIYQTVMLPIRTLRGCFWGKCRFCSYPYISGRFALASPEFVVNNIKELQKKYNIKRFEFIDSSIPANFLKHIAEHIIKTNLDIGWRCRADFQDDFKNIEFVKLLKKSGCELLSLGLESGSNRIMRYMNKLQKDRETVLGIIKILRSEGINVAIYVMLGFPTETKAEAEETIDFVMKLVKEYRCVIGGLSVFNLLEHTYLFDHPHEFKIKKIYNESYTADQGYGHKFDIAEGLSREEVLSMRKKADMFINFPFLYDISRLHR